MFSRCSPLTEAERNACRGWYRTWVDKTYHGVTGARAFVQDMAKYLTSGYFYSPMPRYGWPTQDPYSVQQGMEAIYDLWCRDAFEYIKWYEESKRCA